jgi:two-component system sensor histidine kinase/response regulator
VISVSDTGVGMSQEDIGKLFRIDVHHSTLGTEEEQGTSLGLIICKEMAERNGGQIRVESELGRGTTVEFTVPLAE